MIVDTSVIIALLREEPDAGLLIATMLSSGRLAMSAGTRIEISVVTARGLKHVDASRADQVIAGLGIAIVPVSTRQATIADEGFRRYGQGSGHPARLNFGDCFAYALAKESGEPLLFKGEDFAHTDVTPAL